MGLGACGVGLHFRSWLRKPGRQIGGMSTAESSLSAQQSPHCSPTEHSAKLVYTKHDQGSGYLEVAFWANSHFGTLIS